MKETLLEIYGKIEEKLKAECERLGEKIPYISENGRYQKDMREENNSWWTNGFWAGMLWQMYHGTGEEIYKRTAEDSEIALDRALAGFVGLHHDVGFQFLHTAVADYRLTGREESRVRGLHAASLLAGRFNPVGGFIRAWNLDKTGWMIVDCLMNLPLLYWAGKELDDPRFSAIADLHAHTALQVLLRKDGSCNHIGVLDPLTGELLECPGGQGYGAGSSWSRGQAWAVYGFALAFMHTGHQEYLDGAKQIAHYFLANTALTGCVALTDFRAPEEPVSWDTTASACAACGFLQIAEMVPDLEKRLYYESAQKILLTLAESHCNWNPEEDGILQNGTVAHGREHETHVPIIYGDYFFVEGISRLLGKEFMIW
ncbi:glycoside hydrolase family 88 protein [Lacrimispora sp.]|uniref:glycoside hydrolase family 88 protein n=1 Tax=Lacrimispora sp. TaxID=2719234 RepID=UPI00289ED215|nr:glycoside hydrolase family 88 protein [Lacrimispora sp.]